MKAYQERQLPGAITDGRTDWRTDRQTDGRGDDNTLQAHRAEGKKELNTEKKKNFYLSRNANCYKVP